MRSLLKEVTVASALYALSSSCLSFVGARSIFCLKIKSFHASRSLLPALLERDFLFFFFFSSQKMYLTNGTSNWGNFSKFGTNILVDSFVVITQQFKCYVYNIGLNDEVIPVYILKPKGQLPRGIIMFCKKCYMFIKHCAVLSSCILKTLCILSYQLNWFCCIKHDYCCQTQPFGLRGITFILTHCRLSLSLF